MSQQVIDRSKTETNDISGDTVGQPDAVAIDSTHDFLECFDAVEHEIHERSGDVYKQYYDDLAMRQLDCDKMLKQIDLAMKSLHGLETEYKFVSNKTWSLNSGSEKLIAEQKQLMEISDDIKSRLYYFTQAEQVQQLLQSPTISVSSEIFAQTLDKIDKCLAYIRLNVSAWIHFHLAHSPDLTNFDMSIFRVNSKIRQCAQQNTINVWQKQCCWLRII